MSVGGTVSGIGAPSIVTNAFTREFSAFTNFLFSDPSSSGKSEIADPNSVLEHPQIIISGDVILSTEGNNVLVTKRNENFDDEIIL
tara:strand:- start:415 stop:672 length:258 start_codon:yes stop_codon:yes gene_type:complete